MTKFIKVKDPLCLIGNLSDKKRLKVYDSIFGIPTNEQGKKENFPPAHQKIKKFLAKNKISQNHFAFNVGVYGCDMSNYLRGRRKVPDGVVKAIYVETRGLVKAKDFLIK